MFYFIKLISIIKYKKLINEKLNCLKIISQNNTQPIKFDFLKNIFR